MSDTSAALPSKDAVPLQQPLQPAVGGDDSEGQKSVQEGQQHSIQARATEETSWGAGGVMFYMARAGELISPWWSQQRDRDLDRFWKSSDHLSATIGMLAAKVASVPVRVEPRDASMASHRRQAADYTVRLLEESEYGAGWLDECIKYVLDYWIADNGGFMEVIGGGSPDGPIVGPSLGLAHLDSHRCQRTGEVEYPVLYQDTDGSMYRLHRTRVAFTSDLSSPRAEMYGVGFCALSRSVNIAQHLVDVGVYKQEKLGSRPFRGALFAPGIDYDVVQNAFKLAMEGADNAGLSRFNWLPIIAETEPDSSLQMVSFSSLPDGFNEEISVRLGMFTIALAFGVPIRWIWPTATTGATKGDAMYQHVAGLGGGIGKLLGALTVMLGGSPRGPKHMRGKFLPPHLKMVFDFQDDEQDRMQAEIRQQRATTRSKDLESQVIDLRVAREQALSAGDITDANFAHLELESGRLPDGSSVTTLFSSTDDFFLELLDLGVEEPLAIDTNDPIDMLMEIEIAALNADDIASNATVQSHRHKATQALAALAALKELYMPLVDQQIQADQEAGAALAQQQAGEAEVEPEAEAEEGTLVAKEPAGPATPKPAGAEAAQGAEGQPQEEEGAKQFRWGARVGEVIRGQLARGAGGKFVSADKLQAEAMRDLMERLRARRMEGKGRGGAAAAKRAANRALVGEKVGRAAEIGALGSLRGGEDIGEEATAALISQRLAQQNPDGSVTMTSAGRKLLGAANSGNVDSARQALVDAAKAKKKAGAKPKKDKPEPGTAEYERQRLERNRNRVAKEVGDEVDLDALHLLAEGGQPDPGALQELARRGLVMYDKDGVPHMTSLGREMAEASNSGSTRRAQETLQRGRDVVKRVQAEGKWRREQADKLSVEVRALESDLADKEAELAELARDPDKAEEYEEMKAEVQKLREQVAETQEAAQRAYEEADQMEAAFGGVAPSAPEDEKGLAAAADTKGGPGSGHWAHEGRPGFVGGSKPGRGLAYLGLGRLSTLLQRRSASQAKRGVGGGGGAGASQLTGNLNFKTYESNKLPYSVKNAVEDAIYAWEGARQEMGIGAIADTTSIGTYPGYKLNLLYDGDELVGIGSLNPATYTSGASDPINGLAPGKYSYLGHLATKRPGYGRTILSNIVDEAAAKNVGVYLYSLSGAVSFYETVGMTKGIANTFYLPFGKRIKPKGTKMIDNEPADGAFAARRKDRPDGKPPAKDEEEADEKGGPGSGHWAHEGRPGFVGGSKPGRGLAYLGLGKLSTLLQRRAASAYKREITGGGGKLGADYGTVPKTYIDNQFLPADQYRVRPTAATAKFNDAFNEDFKTDTQIGGVMADNIADAAEDVGAWRSQVRPVYHGWNDSSNDANPQSLRLQKAASEEFDVPLSEWQKDKVEWAMGPQGPHIASKTLLERGDMKKFARHVYNNTQDWYKDHGLSPDDQITLYRGIKGGNIPQGVLKPNSTIKILGNALESWTLEREVASRSWFAKAKGGKVGAVIAMDVPLRAIFSTARTGIGMASEWEVIVFGGREREAYIAEIIGGGS